MPITYYTEQEVEKIKEQLEQEYAYALAEIKDDNCQAAIRRWILREQLINMPAKQLRNHLINAIKLWTLWITLVSEIDTPWPLLSQRVWKSPRILAGPAGSGKHQRIPLDLPPKERETCNDNKLAVTYGAGTVTA